MGFVFGWATRKLIKWLRHRGAKPPQVQPTGIHPTITEVARLYMAAQSDVAIVQAHVCPGSSCPHPAYPHEDLFAALATHDPASRISAQELAVSLAMAYLAFYVANLPLGVSGVTAVVVLGLYGSATGKWMM